MANLGRQAHSHKVTSIGKMRKLKPGDGRAGCDGPGKGGRAGEKEGLTSVTSAKAVQ